MKKRRAVKSRAGRGVIASPCRNPVVGKTPARERVSGPPAARAIVEVVIVYAGGMTAVEVLELESYGSDVSFRPLLLGDVIEVSVRLKDVI